MEVLFLPKNTSYFQTLVRKQWEDSLKKTKVAKNVQKTNVVDENGLGFDLEAELKHEENSKSFNELAE